HLLIEKSGGLLAITSISAPRVEKKHAISWIRKVISFIKKAWNQGKSPILEADKPYVEDKFLKYHKIYFFFARVAQIAKVLSVWFLYIRSLVIS
ncbi:MAG: hypothetical protein WCE84_05630, partial [Candidatus Rhabdochlamydia sp.]